MKKILHLREQRLNRHNQIWSILRFAVTYDELTSCEDFYDYKEAVAAYKEACANLTANLPNKELFEVAFRFFRMEHYQGKCDRALSDEDMESLLGWENAPLNYEDIISRISSAYKEYWDDVLISYKRRSVRQSRISYLVEKLDEYIDWPELKAVNGAVEKIRELRKHYNDMLL